MRTYMVAGQWLDALRTAWRERRTDAGGVADEAAMIAILLGAAVVIAGIVATLVSGAAANLPDIIVPGD